MAQVSSVASEGSGRRADVAEALDVSERSVRRWNHVVRLGGVEALRSAPIPGRAPVLSPEQLQMIPELLWHGAEAYGFRGSVWTCGRIAKVIEEEFGVAYDKGHVSRLLKHLRWTPQLPIQRAIQRDQTVIEHWRQETATRGAKQTCFGSPAAVMMFPGLSHRDAVAH